MTLSPSASAFKHAVCLIWRNMHLHRAHARPNGGSCAMHPACAYGLCLVCSHKCLPDLIKMLDKSLALCLMKSHLTLAKSPEKPCKLAAHAYSNLSKA